SAASARRFSSYCQLWLRLPRPQRAKYEARLRGGLSQTARAVAKDKRCRAKNRAAAAAYCLAGVAGLGVLDKIANRR
ncbi:MAG: hypothetical protein RR825_05615, partial [Ruthenibacterium sp.]